MKNPKDILVTTTSSVDGSAVKTYIKPISAHIVAGTNLFSDWGAAFSDVFGGRSKSYQRQLTSIYDEAINSLKRSAIEVGANCILGLKVDLDEISGKGKSMFMITATGTAVVIDSSVARNAIEEKTGSISIDRMTVLRKKKDLMELAVSNKLKLDEETWDFITNNGVEEIARPIIEVTRTNYVDIPESREALHNNLCRYLMSIPEETRTSLLYEVLTDSSMANFWPRTIKIINELAVHDPEQLSVMLTSSKMSIRHNALQVVAVDKTYFSVEDIPVYDRLVKLIEENVKTTCEYTTQKKLLSKEKEVWVCRPCRTKNDMENDYCEVCSLDRFELQRDKVTPQQAIATIKSNIEFIKNFA